MSRTYSFEGKIQKNRRFTEKIADSINATAGSFSFFILHVAGFSAWIAMNTGHLPGWPIVDPFPFSLLTMIVSLEAIFLSIFVLMSQNRQSAIQSLREEIHLQINQIAEKEVTKSLKLLSEIHAKVVNSKDVDPELDRMLKTLDTGRIESHMEKELTPPKPLVISDFLAQFEKIIHFRRSA